MLRLVDSDSLLVYFDPELSTSANAFTLPESVRNADSAGELIAGADEDEDSRYIMHALRSFRSGRTALSAMACSRSYNPFLHHSNRTVMEVQALHDSLQ